MKNDDDESKIIWKVQCVCGKVFEVASDRFCSSRSCGCLGDENRRKNMKKMHEKYYLENTNVLLITRNKPISSNKSGCTGVTYDKSRNKWVASIEFKGVRYHLGRYDLKKDAIEARKNAEENLYGNFMEWYSKQYPEIHTKIANTKHT